MLTISHLVATLTVIGLASAQQLNLYSDNSCQSYIGSITSDPNECVGSEGANSALLVNGDGVTCYGYEFFGNGDCNGDDDPLTALDYQCNDTQDEGDYSCLDFSTLSSGVTNIMYIDTFEPNEGGFERA